MTDLIEKYTTGKGLDVNPARVLPNNAIRHVYKEADNLYSLREDVSPESLDFIYAGEALNKTKFYRQLIKEWFSALKAGGFLVIDLKPDKILDFNGLRSELSLLLKDTMQVTESAGNTCVVKKIKSVLMPADSIDKWTFGIVSGGRNNDRIERQIEAIRRQGIPEYEIIVCGRYFDRKEPDVKYIHFTEKDDLGWITKKKNIICGNAGFENLMILHDRIVPESGWFEGMKRYGNCFDALSCVVKDSEGKRRGDWFTWGGPREDFGKIGELDYRDWDQWVVLDGALTIIKKSVWEKCRWDESLFWNQGEDIVFSHNLTKKGFLIRFNPYARCKTVVWRHGEVPCYRRNDRRLGKRYGLPGRRSMWFVKSCLTRLGIKK